MNNTPACATCPHHSDESDGPHDSYHRCRHPAALHDMPDSPYRKGGWYLALYPYQHSKPSSPHFCPRWNTD
jgi:hypothetical protein